MVPGKMLFLENERKSCFDEGKSRNDLLQKTWQLFGDDITSHNVKNVEIHSLSFLNYFVK